MRNRLLLLSIIIFTAKAAYSAGENEKLTKEALDQDDFPNYQIIIERNLFQPKDEFSNWGRRIPSSTRLPLTNLYLTGIVYDGSKFLAIIEDRQQKTEGFFAEEELIGEAKVLEINEEEQIVILEYQGEEVTLSLSSLEAPRKEVGPEVSLSTEKAEKIPQKKSLFPIRERLGLHVREISSALSERLKLPTKHGLYILAVNKNSPAGFANLSGGDILTDINGVPLNTIQEAQAAMENISVGSEFSLGVIKKGKQNPEKIAVTLLKE